MAVMMLAAIQMKSQTVMNLTDKQQALVAIAANEAKGNIEALKKEVNAGFEAGLTICEIKEALSLMSGFIGSWDKSEISPKKVITLSRRTPTQAHPTLDSPKVLGLLLCD